MKCYQNKLMIDLRITYIYNKKSKRKYYIHILCTYTYNDFFFLSFIHVF